MKGDGEDIARTFGAVAWELTASYLGKGSEAPVSRVRAEVLGLRLFLFGLHFARHALAKISDEELDRQIVILGEHIGLRDPETAIKATAPMIERLIGTMTDTSEEPFRPFCVECGAVMTPENSRKHPELFLCDECSPKTICSCGAVKTPENSSFHNRPHLRRREIFICDACHEKDVIRDSLAEVPGAEGQETQE